jgi:ABC-2 type transport system ATP-binding protein
LTNSPNSSNHDFSDSQNLLSLPAIFVKNLRKTFGTNEVLVDVSLDFSSELLHGIIGPAGAGKTTLLRLILTLMKCDSGEIIYFVDGKSVAFEKIRADMAYMPQQQSLYADLSIDEHLDFFAKMYGLNRHIYEEKSRQLMALTRLEKFRDRPAGKLSGGMYKKLGLMCSLLRSPRIILLDEPTNGVDPISRREFWNILYDAAASGILVLITTAYLDEAERCGRVHLMENGRVIDEGEPRELLQKNCVDNFDQFFIKRGIDREEGHKS